MTFSLSRITYCDITNLFATCLVCCKIQSTERNSLVLATYGMRTRVRFISGLFSRMRGLMLRVIRERRSLVEARVYVWFIRYAVKHIGDLIVRTKEIAARPSAALQNLSRRDKNFYDFHPRHRLQ